MFGVYYSCCSQCQQYQQQQSSRMTEKVRFDRDLHRFLGMAFEVWPSFQLGKRHLEECGKPCEGALLPNRPYKSMSPDEFQKTVHEDMFEWVMTHEVSAQFIEDYLMDILDLLMVEEDLVGGVNNPASPRMMSRRTMKVIEELQQGKNDQMMKFKAEIYSHVKGVPSAVQKKVPTFTAEDGGEVESDEEPPEQGYKYGFEDESSGSESYESDEEKKPKEEQTEEQKQKEKELQDDGWNIVRKKR